MSHTQFVCQALAYSSHDAREKHERRLLRYFIQLNNKAIAGCGQLPMSPNSIQSLLDASFIVVTFGLAESAAKLDAASKRCSL